MLRFKDGFDYLTSGDIGKKWASGTVGSVVTGVYGKGKAVNNVANLTNPVATIAEGFQGFHFLYNIGSAVTIDFFQDTGSVQVDLRVDATGALFATRNGTTIGSVSTFRMTVGTSYWIVFHVKISTTAGVAEIAVNGTVIANSGVTNLNTQATGNATYNQVKLNSGASQNSFDSFHYWDTAGGDNFSTFIAETIIDTKLAAGVGSNETWTQGGTTHAHNYLQVNEANEDGDSTYNASLTPNQIDSFDFVNLDESSGTVLDVAINTISRIDDATPRVYDHFLKTGASTALSSGISPSGSYLNYQTFHPTDASGAGWTVTTVNSSEFGYKEIS